MMSQVREIRYARCVICKQEGEVVNSSYSAEEIKEERIPYEGDYVFRRICSDCEIEFRLNHPEVSVHWGIDE